LEISLASRLFESAKKCDKVDVVVMRPPLTPAVGEKSQDSDAVVTKFIKKCIFAPSPQEREKEGEACGTAN
jgi:hypothetical protein